MEKDVYKLKAMKVFNLSDEEVTPLHRDFAKVVVFVSRYNAHWQACTVRMSMLQEMDIYKFLDSRVPLGMCEVPLSYIEELIKLDGAEFMNNGYEPTPHLEGEINLESSYGSTKLYKKAYEEEKYREGYKRAMESYRTEDMHYQYFIQFMRDVNSRISKLEKHIEGS